MRKFFSLLLILAGVAAYLHYVQGWDVARLKRTYVGKLIVHEDASATSTPIGLRGVGTHWETVAPMPSPRSEFGAATIGDTIYVVGGVDGYDRTLTEMLAYDIGADAWREAPPLPMPVHHPAVTTDGERLFVLGGFTGIASRPLDSAYVFDPKKDSWEELSRLNDFRGGASAAWWKGRLYVLGGVTTAGVDTALEWYDFAHPAWNGLAFMTTPRQLFAATVVDGKIYAIGGRQGSVAKSVSDVEVYDTAITSWKPGVSMPTARGAIAAVAVDGSIYVLGGEGKSGPFAQVEVLDARKNVWKTLPAPMLSPRHGLVAAAWKNRIYAIGGGRRSGFSVSDLNEVLIIADGSKK